MFMDGVCTYFKYLKSCTIKFTLSLQVLYSNYALPYVAFPKQAIRLKSPKFDHRQMCFTKLRVAVPSLYTAKFRSICWEEKQIQEDVCNFVIVYCIVYRELQACSNNRNKNRIWQQYLLL